MSIYPFKVSSHFRVGTFSISYDNFTNNTYNKKKSKRHRTPWVFNPYGTLPVYPHKSSDKTQTFSGTQKLTTKNFLRSLTQLEMALRHFRGKPKLQNG